MSLVPCPECGRSISSEAQACPWCGYPLAEPWNVRLERAWREGLRNAWIAAVGFPAVVALQAVALDGASVGPRGLLAGLPWLIILGTWGFLAGLVAIAAAGLVRSHWAPRARGDADRWRWSVPAALIAVAAFGAFVTTFVA